MGLISRVSSRTYTRRRRRSGSNPPAIMASRAFKDFLPLFDRVLVQKLEPVTKTSSGIIIPEAAQAKVKQATVMAHGPGQADRGMAMAVGDKVMLPDFGGVEIKLEEEKFMLFRQDDPIGKFE